jgi:hypothetical protein
MLSYSDEEMFGPKMGTWWVYSELDPRWNLSGRSSGLVCEGGPSELQDWIKLCRKNYGEPPEDCEQGFMKD